MATTTATIPVRATASPPGLAITWIVLGEARGSEERAL